MDNLILTIIAAGLIGGIVFLIMMAWVTANRMVTYIDAWSEARAIAKTDLCILFDRIHRGWFQLLPVLKFSHGEFREVDK